MAVDPFRPIFAAAAAVLLAAAVAHADTRDDQFFGLLSNDGLNVLALTEKIIALAHQRCDANGLSRQGWYNFRFGGQPSPFQVAISNINVKLQSHRSNTGSGGAAYVGCSHSAIAPTRVGSFRPVVGRLQTEDCRLAYPYHTHAHALVRPR